jgi:ferritin-like metal-binding protein YciE
MSLNTFEDLFVHKLRMLYSAETQFTKVQPKLAEAASDEELRSALEGHAEVRGRLKRVYTAHFESRVNIKRIMAA